MEVFINGTGLISPQPLFEESKFSIDLLESFTKSRLKCIEPDYKEFINPTQLRRMSRMIKMGIAASKICLKNAGVENPDAIITGTGLGCIEDTEKFILSIIDNDEKHLSPTPFIQSTHNTVGGQIALLLGCHAYNSTYVHRGLSFESALLDAAMLLEEQSAENILVGGLDEITDNSFKLLSELGSYSRKESVGLELSNGVIGGEGATFFLLSGEKTIKSLAKITALKCYTGSSELSTITAKIKECMLEAGKGIDAIDLILLGKSGNRKTDNIYSDLKNGLFRNSKTQTFKQFCGEYHTASAFALWLASMLIGNSLSSSSPSSVLIYNHFGGEEHSILLVERC